MANVRFIAIFDVLTPFAHCAIHFCPIEPDGALASIDAILILHRLVQELLGRHDPNSVKSLGIEHKPIVFAEFVSQCRKQPAITEFDGVGASLDLHLNEGAVWAFDNRVDSIVVYERQVHVKPLLEHETDNPILDTLPEAGGVSECDGHCFFRLTAEITGAL